MAETKDKLATLSQLKTLIDSIKNNEVVPHGFTSEKQAGMQSNTLAYYSFESQVNDGGIIQGFTLASANGLPGRALQAVSPCILIVTITAAQSGYYDGQINLLLNNLSALSQTMTSSSSSNSYSIMVQMETGETLALTGKNCLIYSIIIAEV